MLGARERVLRVLYLGRLSLATAIFVAAIAVWRRADSTATLVATLAFVASLLFTSGSMFYDARREGVLGNSFFYVQVIFDLLLVTAVVHLTQTGTPSQLAPLYILVIAISALLLPPGGVLLIAMLGDVLYFAVTILDQSTAFDAPVMVQLGIFGAVALGCGYIGSRLREAHAGREEMAAELAAFRLREADIVLGELRHGWEIDVLDVRKWNLGIVTKMFLQLAGVVIARQIKLVKPRNDPIIHDLDDIRLLHVFRHSADDRPIFTRRR